MLYSGMCCAICYHSRGHTEKSTIISQILDNLVLMEQGIILEFTINGAVYFMPAGATKARHKCDAVTHAIHVLLSVKMVTETLNIDAGFSIVHGSIQKCCNDYHSDKCFYYGQCINKAKLLASTVLNKVVIAHQV